LFHLFGEEDLGVAQAVAVAVEVGALEGRFGGGCHAAAVGDEGSHCDTIQAFTALRAHTQDGLYPENDCKLVDRKWIGITPLHGG